MIPFSLSFLHLLQAIYLCAEGEEEIERKHKSQLLFPALKYILLL